MMRTKKHFFLIIGVLVAAIFLKWQISTSGQFLTEEGLGSIDLSGLISQSKIILGGFSEGISSSPGKRMVANIAPGFSIVHDTGSTQKICQLSGEYDNQGVTSEDQRNKIPYAKYTINQTGSNYGIFGADLGMSFEHTGKDGIKRLYFLFSDITTVEEGCPGENGARDCIAYSDDTNPEDGISLTFRSDSPGPSPGSFHSFCYKDWLNETIYLGGMVGPREGVSLYGNMYVYCGTDWNETTEQHGGTVLTKSTDDGYTFSYLYYLSTDKFVSNVMAEVVENTNDTAYNGIRKLLPAEIQNQPVLFIYGTDRPNHYVYLAYQPLTPNYQPLKGIEDRSSIRYYNGTGWSPFESDAQPLFEQKTGEEPFMGAFSVAWNQYLNRWIMLYGAGDPYRGINFRVADYPWGPWSDNAVLFNPGKDKDKGYCYFMHTNWEVEHCDYVYDGGICGDEQKDRKDVWGGEYGPYIINKYTTGVPNQKTTIYFTLSTWNPYQTVLMKTTLTVKDTSPPTISGPYYSSGCSIYNPVNGAYFCNDVVIWWLHSDNSGPNGIDTTKVTVGYTGPDGRYTDLTPGATIDQSGGQVTFPASSLADDPYIIKISVSDVAGNPKTVEATAHIQRTDTCKPKFLYDGLYYYSSCAASPYAPVNNVTFSQNVDVSMFWWHSDNSGGVCCFDSGINTATASVGYKPGKPDEGGTYTYLVPTVNTSGGSFVFPIKTSNLANGDYTIKVSVCDKKSPSPNCTEVKALVHVQKNSTPTITLNTPVINGKSVTINGSASPSGGATITRIHWEWGDEGSGDQWFPASHTYDTSGTYPVTATAYDSAGKSASASKSVTISNLNNQPPTLTSFSATPGDYYPGQQISLSFHATDDWDSPSQLKTYYGVWRYTGVGDPVWFKDWTEGFKYTIPSGSQPGYMFCFSGYVQDTDGAASYAITEQVWHVIQSAPSTPMIELDYPVTTPTGSTIVNGTAAPSSGATITKINWNWGDGHSDDQFPPYLFPAYHSYFISNPCYPYYYFDVVATVYDSKGKSAQDGETVSIFPLPCN